MTAIVTRDSIKEALNNPNKEFLAAYIGRALVVLFNNQTEDERRSDSTNKDNGIGFTGADAYSGSLTAKYYLKHKTLLDWQIEKWMKEGKSGYPRLAKYHSQLNTAAEAKRK
jgi:hypothetical protein